MTACSVWNVEWTSQCVRLNALAVALLAFPTQSAAQVVRGDVDTMVLLPPMTQRSFDDLVVGELTRNAPPGTSLADVTAIRRYVEVLLGKEINIIEHAAKLTPEQRERLELAARGVAHRYMKQLDELRRRCTSAPLSRHEYTYVTTLVRRLCHLPVNLPYDQSTFLHKMLATTLSEDQRAAYGKVQRQRQLEAVGAAMRMWSRASNRPDFLEGEQRQQFIEAVLTHAEIPQFTDAMTPYIVTLEVNRVREKLRPVLTESQWRPFDSALGSAARFEPTLRTFGRWPMEHAGDFLK